ncbi:MAG: hypothetical protein ACUVT8_12905 [Armatimonadota bacterium]
MARGARGGSEPGLPGPGGDDGGGGRAVPGSPGGCRDPPAAHPLSPVADYEGISMKGYQSKAPEFIDCSPVKEEVVGITIVRDFSIHVKACLDLIENLPDERELSDIEIRAILAEVITGKLEWAYHQSDGHYKMGAYARAALEQAELPSVLSDTERRQLRDSKIYPYLSPRSRD